MSLREFLLFLVTIMTGVGGQFFLKMGALKLGKVSTSNAVSHLLSILVTPELLFGLTLYGLSAFLYILLLTRVELSVLGPAVSLGYIFSVLMGYFIFHESIPPSRLLALGLIICGVVLLVSKK